MKKEFVHIGCAGLSRSRVLPAGTGDTGTTWYALPAMYKTRQARRLLCSCFFVRPGGQLRTQAARLEKRCLGAGFTNVEVVTGLGSGPN